MQVLAQNFKKRDLKMNFFDEIRKKIFENFLHKVFPKKEIWIGISWIRLDADWIGWDWRDRRRFLFEAKLMTRWFKKLSHLHLILILSSKEMKRYYRHILMFYIMTESSSSETDTQPHRDKRQKSRYFYRHILMLYTTPYKSWFQNWRCHVG